MPWWTSPPSDSAVYESVAIRIAAAGLGDARLPLMSPGYFALVAGSYRWLGSDPWALRLVQVGFGVLTTLATWRLARHLVAPRIALGAGALVAFGGTCVFFDGAVLPESPATLLQVVFAWTLVAALQTAQPHEHGPRRFASLAALAGAELGLLALFRPNALLEALALVGALALAATTRPRRAAATLAALVMLLAVASPLWLATVTGRGMTVTGPASFNLFIGNGPGATGIYRVPPEAPGADSPLTQLEGFRAGAETALGRSLTPAEVDRYWREQTLEHVTRHPLTAVGVLARKVRLFFNLRELGSVLPYGFAREATRTMGAPLVQTGWIAPFALVGLVLALTRRREDPQLFAVAAVTLALVTSVVIAFITDRFRAPAYPLLAVLAVAGLDRGTTIARARPQAGALLLAALGLATWMAWPVAERTTTAPQWTELGDQLASIGEIERAASAYREALARDPGQPRAQEALDAIARGRPVLGGRR